jgi:hypothetical protein
MTATLNGLRVLSCTLHEMLGGVWFADLVIDWPRPMAGTVALEFEGPQKATLLGSVQRSEAFEGKAWGRIAGGRGGLSGVLDAKAYRQVTAGAILDDVAEETGEELSGRITDDIRAAYFQAWHRPRSRAASGIATLAQEIGLSWRVLRSGEIWLGTPEWPDIELDRYGELLDSGDGWEIYAPYGAPLLEPGGAVEGRRIDAVVTTLDSSSLRQRAYYRRASTAGSLDRLRAGLGAFIDGLLGRSGSSVARWDYLALYPATVSRQAANGSLDVLPDDTVVRGAGFSGVRLKTGVPGMAATVPAGTRVLLGWEGGDPSRPYAATWEQGAVTAVVFDGGSQAVAREGDSVDAGTLSGVAGGNPVTFTYIPAGGGVPIVLATIPLTGGAITSGNGKLLA